MLAVRPCEAGDAAAWDALCARAPNGTWLHTRRFLGYHGERFRDASALVLDGERMVGVVPAAWAPDDERLVVSHPGATYGGVVHDGGLAGTCMVRALQALCAHWHGLGARRLHYKPLPHIHSTQAAQDDLFALHALGAARPRCELSSAIDLQRPRHPSERRRRALRKARAAVSVSHDAAHLAALYGVIEANLQRRHGASPVHTLAELERLRQLFPQQVRVGCALEDGEVTAGVVLFNGSNVWHAQYIAASERGFETNALDAVFDALIDQAAAQGARWFDFGTSNGGPAHALNEGLYRFKCEFGGGGVLHEHYVLEL